MPHLVTAAFFLLGLAIGMAYSKESRIFTVYIFLHMATGVIGALIGLSSILIR